MAAPKKGSPERRAMDAFPRKLAGQLHYLRGWQAGTGNAGAIAELVGSYAEERGRRDAVAAMLEIEA